MVVEAALQYDRVPVEGTRRRTRLDPRAQTQGLFDEVDARAPAGRRRRRVGDRLRDAIRDQFIPPTRNLDEPNPACDLDYVPHKGQARRVRAAISNALGFGGHNSVVLFREYNA